LTSASTGSSLVFCSAVIDTSLCHGHGKYGGAQPHRGSVGGFGKKKDVANADVLVQIGGSIVKTTGNQYCTWVEKVGERTCIFPQSVPPYRPSHPLQCLGAYDPLREREKHAPETEVPLPSVVGLLRTSIMSSSAATMRMNGGMGVGFQANERRQKRPN